MEGRYNLYSQNRNGWTAFKNNEELQEEDIWDVYSERNDPLSRIGSFDSLTNSPRRVPAAAWMIPRGFMVPPPEDPNYIQQSAPVTIPDWSKIYGTNTKKTQRNISFHDYDDDELNGEIMPPHEWIAKKLARTQISSFSVCEGAGRTLKGRDLSRVRNAVLTRTGFLE